MVLGESFFSVHMFNVCSKICQETEETSVPVRDMCIVVFSEGLCIASSWSGEEKGVMRVRMKGRLVAEEVLDKRC